MKELCCSNLCSRTRGEQPVDFQFRLRKGIRVCDLDYLRRGSGIPFRDWYVPGPNGYGHIYVRDPGPREGRGHQSEVSSSSSENGAVTVRQAPIWVQPSKPGLDRTLNTDTAMANANDEINAPAVAESGEGDPKLVEKTDENVKNTASVVASITLFVNGRAVKIQDDRDLWHMHTLKYTTFFSPTEEPSMKTSRQPPQSLCNSSSVLPRFHQETDKTSPATTYRPRLLMLRRRLQPRREFKRPFVSFHFISPIPRLKSLRSIAMFTVRVRL